MHNLLVVAFVLTLLLEPAVATSPVLGPVLPVAPMESCYPDPEGMLCAICQLCLHTLEYCPCPTPTLSLPRPPTFTAATFLDHPDWPQDGTIELDATPEPEPEQEPELESEPLPQANAHLFERTPLFNEAVRYLNDNATTVQPSTIQIYVEGTYTPGDRTLAQQGTSRRRTPTKRQAPRPGGFPCTADGCDKTFNRSCDRNRHQKTHRPRSERPHKCPVCNEGFLYPKDCSRHQRTHDQSSSPQATLYCRIPGCSNTDGFSRRDNLLRHQRNQHPGLIAA